MNTKKRDDDVTMAPPDQAVDAFFKEAQDAILRGDDKISTDRECYEFADSLQDLILRGRSSVPAVRAVAERLRHHVPPDADVDRDAAAASDDPRASLRSRDVATLPRDALEALVENLLREQSGANGWHLGSWSEDELRVTARRLLAL